MTTGCPGAVLKQLEAIFGGDSVAGMTDRQLLERFTAPRRESAELAFAALVERHGAMVLTVCRQLLEDLHDAEDAFQATFLVLARKAGSIRQPDRLAPWLYGVARRTARRAKARRGDRLRHEMREAALGADPVDRSTRVEVRLIRAEEAEALHHEIDRLPASYRTAVVLCDLGGLTHREAAQQLGWPLSTVSMRVMRAHERLRARLSRRGLALTTGLFAAATAPDAARAAVPAVSAASAVQAAMQFWADKAVTGGVTTSAAALAEGVLRAMFLKKLVLLGAAGLAVAAVTAVGVAVGLSEGTAAARASVGKERPETRPAAASQLSTPPAPKETSAGPIDVRGQILDPEGKPLPGAKLYLYRGLVNDRNPPLRAVSGPEGRFEFRAAPTDLLDARRESAWRDVRLVAVAPGFGPNCVELGKQGEGGVSTLRVVKDDVPIEGRVLDLEGRPLAGVTVTLLGIQATDDENLTTFSADPAHNDHSRYFSKWFTLALTNALPSVSTGADGQFRLAGVGRERLALLRIDGPTIATSSVRVMTRPRGPLQYKVIGLGSTAVIHGPKTDFHALPPRPIVGTVRDKATGKPVAGVTVQGDGSRATTDQEGRYRLSGVAKGPRHQLSAEPAASDPFFVSVKEASDTQGLEPISVDLELKRGIWVEGRVIDKATRTPLVAWVDYLPLLDNPNKQDVPGIQMRERVQTGADGSFRVLALPGRGQILATTQDEHYLLARDRDDQAQSLKDELNPASFRPCNAFAEISVDQVGKPDRCDLTLLKGRALGGTVLGPDDKPVSGVQVSGLAPGLLWETLPDSSFTVMALSRRRPRTVLFRHEGRKLAGSLEVTGDEPGPLTARLEPWGTVSGRLVDSSGKPYSDVAHSRFALANREADFTRYGSSLPVLPVPTQPGRDGRFRLEGLVPGLKYLFVAEGPGELPAWKVEDLTSRPGETRDLGDLRPFGGQSP